MSGEWPGTCQQQQQKNFHNVTQSKRLICRILTEKIRLLCIICIVLVWINWYWLGPLVGRLLLLTHILLYTKDLGVWERGGGEGEIWTGKKVLDLSPSPSLRGGREGVARKMVTNAARTHRYCTSTHPKFAKNREPPPIATFLSSVFEPFKFLQIC